MPFENASQLHPRNAADDRRMKRLPGQAKSDQTHSHHVFLPLQALNRFSTVLYAPHKFQSRPYFSHRAYLYVYESGGQTNLADYVLIEIGGHAGTFLGQLTHSIPAGASSLLMRWNFLVSAVFDFEKTIAKSSGGFPSRVISHAASFGTQFPKHFRRRIHQAHAESGLDPQLFRKWRS